ncbi:MAG: NAD(P)/FAD-dependent oxidoreductase [Acidobacteria bacterium]|nr:NAD(P)/FAD-dependent oxidoreductase [Acidobacteriota bacterium]
MRVIETDVLVVGAGPGGSTAARYAARGGARTLLIEKKQEIGSPVRCAEGIAQSWMEECEVPLDPAWVACTPEGARIFAPNGRHAVVSSGHAGDEVGLVIERTLFDKALAGYAAQAGAQILLKTHACGVIASNGTVRGVKGKSMGEDIEIYARITIAADGFESQVARWAGMETGLDPCDIISTFQYRLCNIECNPSYCDFYVGSCAPGGYIWVFPKGPGTANVGIGIAATRLADPGQTKASLDRWIAGKPEFSKGQALDMTAGGISKNKPLPSLVSSGFMMVGDAARLINPLTGGGIVNACISGKLAGETAADSVARGDSGEKFLQKYDRAWRDRMQKSHIRNWKAKQKFDTLDDGFFNRIIQTLSETKPHANTLSMLLALAKKHPTLVADFVDLLWT